MEKSCTNLNITMTVITTQASRFSLMSLQPVLISLTEEKAITKHVCMGATV